MQVRELILDCLATNPRNRPTAKEIVECLRAMPGPPPSAAAGAAGGSQRSRLGGRRRSGALPPPGPGARAVAEMEQPAAGVAGAADGRQQPAGVPAHALAPARLPAGRPAVPRRSSESDSSLRSIEAAAGSPAYGLPAAYASPATGGLALATQWLQAAANSAAGGTRSSSMALAGRRAGSMVPGALPSSATALQPPTSAQRLMSASSSPPGSLPEPPLGPVAAAVQRQGSHAAAALRVPRPPRPAPSVPLSIARQASLDDPATQLAGEVLQGVLPRQSCADACPEEIVWQCGRCAVPLRATTTACATLSPHQVIYFKLPPQMPQYRAIVPPQSFSAHCWGRQAPPPPPSSGSAACSKLSSGSRRCRSSCPTS